MRVSKLAFVPFRAVLNEDESFEISFCSFSSFQATIGYLNLPTSLWVICGGETVSNSVFAHDLCKLIIAKMSTAITDDSSRGTKSGQNEEHERLHNPGNPGQLITKTQNMGDRKDKLPYTKHLFAQLHTITTDKHGLPPTKRLFKVAELDPILRIHWFMGNVWRSGNTNCGISPPK
nr:hypothetical protein [Tanacetum cinerariifolium]